MLRWWTSSLRRCFFCSRSLFRDSSASSSWASEMSFRRSASCSWLLRSSVSSSKTLISCFRPSYSPWSRVGIDKWSIEWVADINGCRRSGNGKEGGAAELVNNRCKAGHVSDIELLDVSFCPYYLLWELTCVRLLQIHFNTYRRS